MTVFTRRTRSPQTTSGSSGAFYTTFGTTENPISEGGIWVRGAAEGDDWNNPLTTGGHAVASVASGLGGSRYDDSIAHLSTSYRSFAANQYAKGTVYKAAGYDPDGSHEIELLLRWNITSGNARGYETLIGITASNQGYIAIVRWNGSLGSYTALYDPGAGSIALPADGDVFEARISGTTITVYRNGSAISGATATDSTYSSGQPGIGFWPVDGALPGSYGWAYFEAGDL